MRTETTDSAPLGARIGSPIRVLAFGDSNTWGFAPIDPAEPAMRRLPSAQAWPGVAQAVLGPDFEILVDALPGRTIATEREDMAGRWVSAGAFNGTKELAAAIVRHAPLDLVVVQLGANDLVTDKAMSASDIASRLVAMAKIITEFRLPVPLAGMAVPLRAVMIVPPAFGPQPSNPAWAADEARRAAIAPMLVEAGRLHSFAVIDAALSGATPGADGLHFDADAHDRIGRFVALAIRG